MSYDLDTPEGMANAIAWTDHHLSRLKEGGTWYIPRSGTVVTVVNHDTKCCEVAEGRPDPTIERVLRAAGWAIKPAGYSLDDLEKSNPHNSWMYQ